MNGTATTPVDHSRVEERPRAISRESSSTTPSPAPSDSVVVESKSATATTNGGGRAGSGTVNGRQQDDSMEGDPFIDITSANGTGTNLGTDSRSDSKTGGSAASGSGVDSSGSGSGEAGGFSVGDESVVLWEEPSVEGSAPATAPVAAAGCLNNGGLGSQHTKGSGPALVPDGDDTDGAPADGVHTCVNTGGSTQTSAVDESTAADIGFTNAPADGKNGMKQAGGRGEEMESPQDSVTGTDDSAANGGGSGDGPLKSADETQNAVNDEEDMVTASAAPARVVGWASGLFRCVVRYRWR